MAAGEESTSDEKSLLLFDHKRFSLYLHEESGQDDLPLALLVRLKPSSTTQRHRSCGSRDFSEAIDAAASCDVLEKVFAVDGQSYFLRSEGSDISLEFGPESDADCQSSCQPPNTGCWYAVDEESDRDIEFADSTEFRPPPRCMPSNDGEAAGPADAAEILLQTPEKVSRARFPWPKPQLKWHSKDGNTSDQRPFADPGNSKCLASCDWHGCDLEDDIADDKTITPRAAKEPSANVQKDDDICDEGCTWYLGAGAEADKTDAVLESGCPSSSSTSLPVLRSTMEIVHLSSSKVEWRICRIASKMSHYPKGCRVFSPEFDAFGVSGLGLVFYPNGNSNAKAGFCSLGLKAPHGTHLRYKLYIGSTERFTDLRHNVTESWGFVDMCKVEDELQQDEDLLRLGVEIIDDIDVNETLKSVSPHRVEWNISGMRNKLMHYRKDVAVYSDEFSAGGVDKLRLKFYPSGKKEADPGWCSLYLEAPKGSELRCRLSVGRKSMSFDRLEKFGEDSIWGFLTLCKLRDELEQDGDCVRIALEVLETRKLDGRLSEAEDTYLKSLSIDKRTHLLSELDRVENFRNSGDGAVPSRFRILQLDVSDSAKAIALSKLDAMQSDTMSGESAKLKKWMEGLLSIPFGRLRKPLVSIEAGKAKVQKYLDKASTALDEAVYGHEEPKKKIVQLLCQWIANPESSSFVLGIQGPPGNGKTTLCRKGIAEALGRPFVQVSLGGATDASVLEGHSYTYVGSTWGRIAGLIMEAKCMNPVIFFDELDKVSDTPRGHEIIGVLTHLTDHSQNKTFADRYFEGIPLDLSRALFIFSFNDETRLNPVLKDRLTVINTEGFDQTAKAKISREYLLPDLLANVAMKKDDVDIGREELTYLCNRCGVSTEEGGVRGIKQALEGIILHLNEIRMTQDDDDLGKADDGKKKEDELGKADDGEKKDGDREQKQSAESRSRLNLNSSESGRKAKKVRVNLPVVLTTDLIDRLVTQKDNKRGPAAMMYV